MIGNAAPSPALRGTCRAGAPTILTFVSHYLPGFRAGGPLRSIANTVEALGAEFRFRIVTSDRDSGDGRGYPGVEPGVWNRVGGAEVLYLPPERRTLRAIARVMTRTPHDLLYLNSLLDFRFSILPLAARRLGLALRTPVLTAPRGELASGAFALKPGRKRAFLITSRLIGLHRGLMWKAASAHEAEDIRRRMGSQAGRVVIAAEPPRRGDPQLPAFPRDPGAPLRIVFLSRIAPMKNLTFVLEVLSHVGAPVVLTIHGPRSDSRYWQQCAAMTARMPPHVRVDVRGEVRPENVVETLSRHDLFFLPSLGENQGHAILDAFASGTPVLISDRTPWRDLEISDLGWDLPLGEAAPFVKVIEALAVEDPDRSLRRREACAAFARSREDDRALRDAFLAALAAGG